jgi:hypothetical protein
MHFSINGISVYRFKKPSLRFVWFVQHPATSALCLVGSLLLFVLSLLCWLDAMFNNGNAELFALVFMGAWFLMLVFRTIRIKRRGVISGQYREYYVTIDDYSFQLLFVQRLLSYGELSNEALKRLFEDKAISEADKVLRSLGFERPEELRVKRIEQLRVINLIQAAYLNASAETPYRVIDELQQQRRLITSMTNHMAHDRLDKLDGQRRSLIELIEETETFA